MAKRRGNAEGSIYKREIDGRWVGSLHVGYESGKRRRKVFYGRTRREVAEKLNKAVRAQAEGLPLPKIASRWAASFASGWTRRHGTSCGP